MNDLMVDIETLGTGANSVITQIGAVYFNRYTGELKEEFLINIQIQDCLNKGLKVDAGALKFWFNEIGKKFHLITHYTIDKNGNLKINEIEKKNLLPTFLKTPVSLSKALAEFRKFVSLHTEAPIWAHSTFDFPRLADAYEILGEKAGFSYKRLRDIRTLIDLSGIKREGKKKEIKTHDALEDCKRQVKYCVEAFKLLKNKVGEIDNG